MVIQENLIPLIEKCLNFKLHEHQKGYLLGKGDIPFGTRGNGKTTAYCIRLALSDGEPLDLYKPEKFSDRIGAPNHISYARHFFRHEFIVIRNRLKDYGFEVRDVIERRY